MKRKLAMLLMAALMAVTLAGCGDDESESEVAAKTEENREPQKESNLVGPSSSTSFDKSATKLGLKDGTLQIARRTREKETSMGDDDWTILVYLCGTDLESEGGAAALDLEEAMDAEFSENVHIVYQTGGCNEWSYDISNEYPERYERTEEGIDYVDETDPANMGDSKTLEDFLRWGIKNYPAEHMGLVFWDHGSGSINGVCFDELYEYDSLLLTEIDEALNNVYDDMTSRFEFIGFDACLMGTIETASMLVPYAKYMFASQESEPGNGWDYLAILNALAENSDMDGSALGKVVADSYYKQCEEADDDAIATFSIVDLGQVDGLMEKCDKAFAEMLDSDAFTEIVSNIMRIDNFGGNNKSEGYTNMVDLMALLNTSSSKAANDAVSALGNAISYMKNGEIHEGAGGLSIYYPLSVQGSNELETFAQVCVSPHYNAMVNKVGYGYNNGTFDGFDPSPFLKDTENIQTAALPTQVVEVSSETDEREEIDEDSDLIESIYFDDDGVFSVALTSMDELSYAACSVYYSDDDSVIYLGTLEDVAYDENMITDNFDGYWPCMDGLFLPIELVYSTEDTSIYTCPILLNDETETNLRIEYDWNEGEFYVIGLVDGVDEETGMTSKVYSLEDGDVIAPIYYEVLEDDSWEPWVGDEIVIDGEPEIYYDFLPEADYLYSIELYDIYGNTYYTPFITFSIDENGDLWFYPEDLE